MIIKAAAGNTCGSLLTVCNEKLKGADADEQKIHIMECKWP